MKKYCYVSGLPWALIAFVLILLTTILSASCSKQDPRDFTKVVVTQAGELVVVEGFLEHPKPVDWAYSISVQECDRKVDRLVMIPKGEVYGIMKYQTNCKIGNWIITYDNIYVQ